MAIYRQLLILSLLLFSGLVISSNASSSDFSETNLFPYPQINNESPEEGFRVYVGDDGYIWADYWISSSTVSFDAHELESLIPSQYFGVLESISIEYYPSEHANVRLYLNIRSANHGLAEEYAALFVDAITTGTLFDFSHQTTYSFEYWDNEGIRVGTTLEFSATIDVNHLVPYVADALSDSDLIPQFDYNKLYAIRLNIYNWNHDFSGSLSFSFESDFESSEGGHVLSLNDLTGATNFHSSLSNTPFLIEVNLPRATNANFIGITNGPDTTVSWVTNDDGYVHGTIEILHGTSLTTVSVSFDYSFQLWHWRNRENIYWEVNQRGFENYNFDIYGKNRLIPDPNLAYNSTLMADVLDLNLQLSSTWNEGHFQVTFSGYDFRQSEYTQIQAILNGLGVSMYNGSVYNQTTMWSQWINNVEIEQDARVYWASFDIFESNFTTVVNSFASTTNSALLQAADLGDFGIFRFGMYSDKWGLYPIISLSSNYVDSPTHPKDQIPRFTNGTHFIDPLNMPFLTLSDDFPWNEYSDEFSFQFTSPYNGNEVDITVSPESNWGNNWWSNLWLDQYDYPHIHYEVVIQGEVLELVNEYGEGTGISPDFSMSFIAVYYSVDVDLAAPNVDEVAWRDYTVSDFGYDNHDSYPRNFNSPFSGSLDMIAIVRDYGADGWWYNATGNYWTELYESSDIADVSGYLTREDTPFNHAKFKSELEYTYVEDYNPGISSVYSTSFDTTSVADGWYELMVETLDNAGNEGRYEGRYLLVDNYADNSFNAATINWDSKPEYGDVVTGGVTFEFSTEDDAGIYAAILWVNGGGYLVEPSSTNGTTIISQEFSYVLNSEAFDDGTPLFVWAEVLDFDGHWSSTDDILIFAGEPATSDPPEIRLIDPTGDFTHDAEVESTITFTVEVQDDFGTYQPVLKILEPDSSSKSFTFSAITPTVYSVTITVTNWPTGDYTWFVEVTDIGFTENTVETESHTLTLLNGDVVADNEDPTLAIAQPTDLEDLSGDVTFEVEAYDNVAIQQISLKIYEFSYTMASSVAGHYTYTVDTSVIPDGEYTISITATDTSGNTATINIIVSFKNGNTKSPDLGIPLQVPWFLVFVTAVAVVHIRKTKKY